MKKSNISVLDQSDSAYSKIAIYIPKKGLDSRLITTLDKDAKNLAKFLTGFSVNPEIGDKLYLANSKMKIRVIGICWNIYNDQHFCLEIEGDEIH